MNNSYRHKNRGCSEKLGMFLDELVETIKPSILFFCNEVREDESRLTKLPVLKC